MENSSPTATIVETFSFPDGSTYHGQLRKGKPHGQGSEIRPDGTTQYKGEYKNGKRHGVGVYYFPNGGKYKGEFKNNNKHGCGVFQFLAGEQYEGEFAMDRMHGKGVFIGANGEEYKGQYVYGTKHGKGVYTWPDGKRYDGELKNGTWHGKGTYTYPEGANYKGDFINGKRNGRGVYTWADGSKYNGQWQAGKMHGRGVHMDPKGHVIYDGMWRDGIQVLDEVSSSEVDDNESNVIAEARPQENETNGATNASNHECALCGKDLPSDVVLLACGRCVSYCDSKCQRAAWEEHKKSVQAAKGKGKIGTKGTL
jgi:hypothetical protein